MVYMVTCTRKTFFLEQICYTADYPSFSGGNKSATCNRTAPGASPVSVTTVVTDVRHTFKKSLRKVPNF